MSTLRAPIPATTLSAIILLTTPAAAQQVLWGTSSPANSGTAYDQAAAHAENGHAAGQVHAAKKGIHFGSNVTINSIGSQNIVSVTGDDNNITSSQSGSNAGNISGTLNTDTK